MSDFNPYQPPAEPASQPSSHDIPTYLEERTIGGWLVLIGLGVVLTPFAMMVQLGPHVKSIFFTETWAFLTTPGSEGYHALWAPFLIVETVANAIFFVAWIYMGYLFFSKRRAFPKWYIWTNCGMFAFLIADTLALQVVRPDLSLFGDGAGREMARSAFTVCVWVPYMLMSKRVEETFRH